MKFLLCGLVLFLVLVAGALAAAPNATIIAAGNMLELREPLGAVRPVLTGADLTGLASGTLTTPLGTTAYSQSLSLGNTSNGLQPAAVNYIRNDDDIMADYLVVDVNQPFLEWNLTFSPGLASSATGMGGGYYRLVGLEDVKVPLLGTNYTVLFARLQNTSGSPLTIHLARSDPVVDTLLVGQERRYTINGTVFDVRLLWSNTTSTIFIINGASFGDAEPGVPLVNSTGAGIVVRNSTTLGATFAVFSTNQSLSLLDSATNDTAYDCTVEAGMGTILSDAECDLIGTLTSGTTGAPGGFNLTKVSYQLTMDGNVSSTEYVPAGHGVREYMRRPQGLLGADFDIQYQGLSAPASSFVDLVALDNQTYYLSFHNTQGQLYGLTYLSNTSGVLKFGNATSDLVFVEATSNTSYNIGINDTFVVTSSPWDNSSVSNLFKYVDYDNVTTTATFTDLSTGGTNTAVLTDGSGTLFAGGHSYVLYAENWNGSAPHRLAIDQNGDGNVDGAQVGITVYGGGLFNLANTFSNTTGSTTAPASLSDVIGDGANISGAVTAWTHGPAITVESELTTLASRFETQGGDELFDSRIGIISGGGLDYQGFSYIGPLSNNSANLWSEFTMDLQNPGSSSFVGMTDYGILSNRSVGAGSASDNLSITYLSQQRNATVVVVLPQSAPLATATLPPSISLTVTNGSAIYGTTFRFNVTVGTDASNITYTISNGTQTWSGGTLATRNSSNASTHFNSTIFNGIYLPAGNWTLNVTATNGASNSASVTANLTSYPAILATLVSDSSQSAAIGGSDIGFSFNVTTKGAGSVVEAFLVLTDGAFAFNDAYARLSSNTSNATVSGSTDYSGAGSITLSPIVAANVPAYVTMPLNTSGAVYQQTLTLALTPYNGLSAGTYTGSYGFGVFG